MGARVTSARVLGACGLVASFLAMMSGATHIDALLAASGAIMVGANVFALVKG